MHAIALIGTLDTKGDQVRYVKDLIEEQKHQVIVIDVGVIGEIPFKPDISRANVAEVSGTSIEDIIALDNPNSAMIKMAQGSSTITRNLCFKGKINGVMAVGGSMATALALEVMNALPLGFPKLIVSTVAYSAAITPDFIGGNDVMMLPWVGGLWGLNSLSKNTLEIAASAISGAAAVYGKRKVFSRRIAGITSLGGTVNRYISQLKVALNGKGFESAVFHVTGMSGRIYEKALNDGLITISLDLSVGVELLNHVTGGVCSAGVHRLETAGKLGIPQIISPGAIEVFHWGKNKPLPKKYRNRPNHPHNNLLLAVMSSTTEMAAVGELIARKLNKAKGPTAVVIPMKGFGETPKSTAGKHAVQERESLLEFRKAYRSITQDGLKAFQNALTEKLKSQVIVLTLEAGFNDPIYVETIMSLLDEMIKN